LPFTKDFPTMSNLSIYLAGPEVFLPDAAEVGQSKKRLCESYRFAGLYPLDNEIDAVPSGKRISNVIFAANVELMRSADLIIANLSPFRGPSADPGTVFELGFMMGLGKLTYGYSNVAGTFLEKNRALGGSVTLDADRQAWVDSAGMSVENFGIEDNLMITECLATNGFPLVVRDVPSSERFRDLQAFEQCLQLVRRKVEAGYVHR
jgi:nucleoside 2-deoxyribosyltransferase